MEATSRTITRQRLKREKRTLRAWKACIFLLVLIAEIIGAYWIVYRGSAFMGDAVSRTANAYYVLFLEPHKLASIGFVWNPLPSLVQLLIIPFAKIWRPLASSALAGCIASALFASANASLLFGYLKKAGCKTALSLLFVGLYAFNPFIFYYGLNGMSETYFFTAMIVCTANFALWMDQRKTGQLVAVGLMLAVGFLTRYETFALMLAIGLAMLIVVYLMEDRKSPFLKKPGKMKWDYSVATGTVLFLPVLYTVAMWMFLNWSIMGDPLFFLRSAYSNESQSSVALFSDFREQVRNPFYALGYVLTRMIPFIPPFLVVTAERIATKRLIKPDYLILLVFIGALTGFHYVMLMAGKSFGWLRFYCFSLIFTVAWIPYELTQLQGKVKKMTTIFLCAALLLSAAIVPFYLSDNDLAREEYQALYHGDMNKIGDQAMVAEKINEKYSDSTILLDAFMTSSMILNIEHPENLVTNIADSVFDLAVADPHDQLIDYVVVPDNQADSIGTLDAINQAHPRLSAYGADWADLVYEVEMFKLYKVLQWDQDVADLTAEIGENYSDAVLLFDNSTSGMLHKNLKNPKRAITLTSENFEPALEDPKQYGVDYIIVPRVLVDSSGSRDDILHRYPELMDAGADWVELAYENDGYRIYKVLYPDGWVKEDIEVPDTGTPTRRITTQQRELARFLNATSARSLLLIDPGLEERLPGLLTSPESLFTSTSVGFEDALLDPERYQIRYMILPAADDESGRLQEVSDLLPDLYENGPAQTVLVFENDAYRVYESLAYEDALPENGAASLTATATGSAAPAAATALPVATERAAAVAATATPPPAATQAPTGTPTTAPTGTPKAAATGTPAGQMAAAVAGSTSTAAPSAVTPTATSRPTARAATTARATVVATASPVLTSVPTATAKAAASATSAGTTAPSITPTEVPRTAAVTAAVVVKPNMASSTPTSAATPSATPTLAASGTTTPHVLAIVQAIATPTASATPITTTMRITTSCPTMTATAAAADATLPRTLSTVRPEATKPPVDSPINVTTTVATPSPTVAATITIAATATPRILATVRPAETPAPTDTPITTTILLTTPSLHPTTTPAPTGTTPPRTTVSTLVPAAMQTAAQPAITRKATPTPTASATALPTAVPALTVTPAATATLAPNATATASQAPTDRPDYLGWIVVQAHSSANVRREGTIESEVVHIVREGDWYPVLSIAESGWYEIQITRNLTGFISPKLVSRLYYGDADVSNQIFEAILSYMRQ